MAQWADIAGCYRWLHDRAEKKQSRSNAWITIPVIVLSTLTGTANFALDSFIEPNNDSAKRYAQAGIGAASIFAGILTTLGNFLRYAQGSEAHRGAAISWGKFQRQIAVELAINPMDRLEAMDFLKICRQDLDRLIEQSPQIPDPVIAEFEREFKSVPDLKMPDICHGLEHTTIYNSNKARLTKMTADAAIFLKQKKKLLRDDILPDLSDRIHTSVETVVQRQMGERIKELEERIQATASQPRPEEAAAPPARVLEGDWRRLLVSRHKGAVAAASRPVTPGERNVVITVYDEDNRSVVTSTSSLPAQPDVAPSRGSASPQGA